MGKNMRIKTAPKPNCLSLLGNGVGAPHTSPRLSLRASRLRLLLIRIRFLIACAGACRKRRRGCSPTWRKATTSRFGAQSPLCIHPHAHFSHLLANFNPLFSFALLLFFPQSSNRNHRSQGTSGSAGSSSW
jgi:hypothetical protein